MTAPTISSPTPTADVNDVLASIAGDSIKQTMDEQATAPNTPRDERGKFAPRNPDKPASEPVAPAYAKDAPADATAETDPAPVVLPEGMVAVPTIARELATTFTVADAEGAIEPPDLTIEFTANGKNRREPLDKVVKLAQWGVYNHEKQQQAEAALAEAQQLRTQMAQYDAAVRQLQAERQHLLSNDDAYLNARALYEQQNTPEARLQQERQQVKMERAQMDFQQAQHAGTAFLDTKVEPALELIASALPSVSKEELAARVLLVANPFTVQTPFGAIIHPDAHARIAEAIRDEVVPWAQQVHDARHAQQNERLTETEKRTASLQVEAQRAKNLAAKSIKPTGNAGTVGKSKRPIRNVDDAMNDVLASALESVGIR